MTASNFRVVRRRRASQPAALTASLTAAVAPVKDPTKIFSGSTGARQPWQEEAWRFTKCVGELGYFVRWRSNACAQVRLIASSIDPETGLPTGSVDEKDENAKRVVELVQQIAGGPLGQKSLIKRAAACLTVTGELWICILQRPEGERWYAVTKNEIKASQKIVEYPDGRKAASVAIQLPDRELHDYDPNNDAMFRVWNEAFDDATEADSPVRAVLPVLAEIEHATKKINNADRSRLLNNGLLMVPSEASLPDNAPDGTTNGSRRVATSLQKMLVQAATTVTQDENSLVSVLPIVAAAPGEHLGKIAHIEFSKEATKTAVEIRTDSIGRLAMGLDVSPERLLGMGNNSNHWSAYLLADEDVKLHVNPVLEVLVQAIQQAVIAPMLQKEGIDPNKYTLWFDASRLTADPDITDEAKDAFTSGAIRGEAFVKALGLPADARYDMKTEEGLAEWARDRVSEDPRLLPMLAQLIPELKDRTFTDIAPTDDSTSDDGYTDSDAATEEPDTETNDPTEPAYAIAEDLLVNRALELAAKRRIHTNDRLTHARLRHLPVHERNRHLPPVSPDKIAKLVEGWDDILTSSYAARTGLSLDRLRAAVTRRVTAELTAGQSNVHTLNGKAL
ncbi:portal protein [Mycobacterium phage Cepens]|nr:portal protein [Mycobacterium phage Cepens]